MNKLIRPVLFAILAVGVANNSIRSVDAGEEGGFTRVPNPIDVLPQLLEEMAEASLRNYNRIRTLRANYVVTDTTLIRENQVQLLTAKRAPTPEIERLLPIIKEDKVKVQCLVDVPADRLRCYFETSSSKFKSLATDAEIQTDIFEKAANEGAPSGQGKYILDAMVSERAILTGDEFISIAPKERYGDFNNVPTLRGYSGRAAFRDFPEAGDKLKGGTIVDPRMHFGYSKPCWEFYHLLRDQLLTGGTTAEAKGRVQLFVDTSNDKTRYMIQIRLSSAPDADPNGDLTFEYVADESVAYNLAEVQVHRTDGTLYQRVQWDHIVDDGVVIPSSIFWVRGSRDDMVMSSRRTKMSSWEINKSFDEAEFEYAALGLRDGEVVYDRIRESAFIYKNGELSGPMAFKVATDIRSGSVPLSGAAIGVSWPKIAVIINVILVVIVVVLLLRGRKRGR